MDNELLRKVQLVQLEILKEFKRVCEALNLKYILDSGTLLGAVRHGGFIPWDDDLDVGMLRADYEKFLAEAPALLDKKYFLQTWRTDPGFARPFAKLRMNDTIFREADAMYANQHLGIFIDIFPYDVAIKSSRLFQLWRRWKLGNISFALSLKHGYGARKKGGSLKKKLRILVYKIFYYLSGNARRSREQLFRRYEYLHTRYNDRNTGWMYPTYFHTFPSSIWESLTPLRFEDDEFLCPTDYDTYLKVQYNDYMTLPPEEKRGNRHGIIELKLPGESVSIHFDQED